LYDLKDGVNEIKTDYPLSKQTMWNHECGNWTQKVKYNRSPRSASAPPGTGRSSHIPERIYPFLQKLENIVEKMKQEGKPTEILQQLYYHLIALNRTSFLEASKPENYVFMWALIKAGQLFPTVPPTVMFPYLSDKQISAHAQDLGRKEINDLLHLLNGSEVCVSIDESLIANRHTILCLLHIPGSGMKPIPFKMYTKGTKRSDYAKLCATVFFHLKKYNITVLNFIGDGLLRQSEACSPALKNGYSKYLKLLVNKDKRDPYIIPRPSWETQKTVRDNWLTSISLPYLVT
jgi:hypothetical protein